jgi:hypothetical protein
MWGTNSTVLRSQSSRFAETFSTHHAKLIPVTHILVNKLLEKLVTAACSKIVPQAIDAVLLDRKTPQWVFFA